MTSLKGHTPAATYTQLLYIEPSPSAGVANVSQDSGSAFDGQTPAPLNLVVTANQANVVQLTGATTGNPAGLSVFGSDTNAGLTINAKGSGTIIIGGVSTGGITLGQGVTITTGKTLTLTGVTITGGTPTFDGVVTVLGGANPLLTTSSAITSGAGSSAGTLTNAPAIGNPTKWVPINDHGTTRYFPAW